MVTQGTEGIFPLKTGVRLNQVIIIMHISSNLKTCMVYLSFFSSNNSQINVRRMCSLFNKIDMH